MDAGNNQSINGWNKKFFQNKIQKLQASMQQKQPPKQIQQSAQIPLSTNNKSTLSNNISTHGNSVIQKQEQKKLSPDDVIAKGRIIKIIEKTLNANEFKVQIEYEEQIIELIASKQDVIKNNIIPLLDFYEKTLSLR